MKLSPVGSVTKPETPHPDIEAKAAAWVIRFGGDRLAPEEYRDFETWLGAHPDHRAAFDYACQIWGGLAALRAAPGAPGLGAASPPPSPWYRSSRPWLGGAAAAVLILLSLGTYWFGDTLILATADHRTMPAERRMVALADGSTIDLGPASAIDVNFTDAERRIELLAGLIYVTAAPMGEHEKRPFVVGVAEGTAKALGTQFMVDLSPENVQVTVTEHRVEVTAPRHARDTGPVFLSSGQSVRYDRAAGIHAVEDIHPDWLTAWRRGRLIFDSLTLGQVVTELNRYRYGRIVIADAALAERRVSAAFETADLDKAVESIARELGLRVLALQPFVTLLY